ncbi:MAG: SRPBCC family protein [Mycobacterium sp.]|nr:SRPBCC family protein [Mycobacterium sp.]
MEVHEVAVERVVDASLETVWELITDITLMPRFSSELQRVKWADGFDAPCIGARFVGVNRHPNVGEWTTTSTVLEYDRPRIFSWAVGDLGNPAATWQFELTPSDAACAVLYTARIGPGPSGVTMLIERQPDRAARIIADRLGALSSAMAATLAGIAGLAEGES